MRFRTEQCMKKCKMRNATAPEPDLLVDGLHPGLVDAVPGIGQPVVPGLVDGAGEVEQLAAVVEAAATLAEHPHRVPDIVEHQGPML